MNKELLIKKFPWLFDVVGDFKLQVRYNSRNYEKDNHIKTRFNSMFTTDTIVAAYKEGKVCVTKQEIDYGSNNILLVCKNITILEFSSSEWAVITIIKG